MAVRDAACTSDTSMHAYGAAPAVTWAGAISNWASSAARLAGRDPLLLDTSDDDACQFGVGIRCRAQAECKMQCVGAGCVNYPVQS